MQTSLPGDYIINQFLINYFQENPKILLVLYNLRLKDFIHKIHVKVLEISLQKKCSKSVVCISVIIKTTRLSPAEISTQHPSVLKRRDGGQ